MLSMVAASRFSRFRAWQLEAGKALSGSRACSQCILSVIGTGLPLMMLMTKRCASIVPAGATPWLQERET